MESIFALFIVAARNRTRRLPERLRLTADISAAEERSDDEHVQWLIDSDTSSLRVCGKPHSLDSTQHVRVYYKTSIAGIDRYIC